MASVYKPLPLKEPFKTPFASLIQWHEEKGSSGMGLLTLERADQKCVFLPSGHTYWAFGKYLEGDN